MRTPPLRTLIVGGAGFIGARLVEYCLAKGEDVHVLVRPTTGLDRLASLGGRVPVHAAPIADRGQLDAVIAQVSPDRVFHLATGDRRAPLPDLADVSASVSEDLIGLVNLIAACAAAARPPKVMVRASSLAEYGPVAAPYNEAQQEMPLTAYAAALVAGTAYARMVAPRLSFALVTARLALCYGPGQSDRFLVPQLVAHALARRRMNVLRPFDRRDLMHVDDAAAGLDALSERPIMPIVNLSTGIAPMMAEVAGRIFSLVGADAGLLDLGPRHPPGGTKDFRGSNELARRLLGWQPKIAWEQGLEDICSGHDAQSGKTEMAA